MEIIFQCDKYVHGEGVGPDFDLLFQKKNDFREMISAIEYLFNGFGPLWNFDPAKKPSIWILNPNSVLAGTSPEVRQCTTTIRTFRWALALVFRYEVTRKNLLKVIHFSISRIDIYFIIKIIKSICCTASNHLLYRKKWKFCNMTFCSNN